MSKINTIDIDLDGVMTDYDSNMIRLTGFTVSELMDMDIKDRVNIKNQAKDKGLFSTMKLLPGAADAFYKLISQYESKGYTLRILTATGEYESERSAKEKIAWVRANLCTECEVICVTHARDKLQYAGPNSILIDDYETTCDMFNEGTGNAIHHEEWPTTLNHLERAISINGEFNV